MWKIEQKTLKRLLKEAGTLGNISYEGGAPRETQDERLNEIVEDLLDLLEKDGTFKENVLKSALLDPTFEQEIVRRLKDELKAE